MLSIFISPHLSGKDIIPSQDIGEWISVSQIKLQDSLTIILGTDNTFKNVEFKSLLWKAARVITVEEANKALNDMRAINPRSVDWLLGHAAPEHWAELYFPGRR